MNKKNEEWLMKVNNNLIGRLFLWYFKRVLNRDTYTIKKRGRHPDRQGTFKRYNITPNYDQDIPVRYAKYWGIYLVPKDKNYYLKFQAR